MIKSIGIQNFKAIGKMAHIPVKPITLIFGPNSAGKSSIIQSLLMLKQSQGLKAGDALRTKGLHVDLGNYKELIHRHDLSNELSFQFELDSFIHKYSKEDFVSSRAFAEWRDYIERLNIVLNGEKVTVLVKIGNDKGKPQVKLFSLFVGSESTEAIISYCRNEKNTRFSPCVNSEHEFWQRFDDTFSEEIKGKDISLNERLDQAFIYMKSKKNETECEEIKSTIEELKRLVAKVNYDWSAEYYKQSGRLAVAEIVASGFLPEYLNNILVSTETKKTWNKTYSVENLFNGDINIDRLKDPAIYLSQASKDIQLFLNCFEHIEPLRKLPQRYYSKVDDASLIKVFNEESVFDYLADETNIEIVNESFSKIGIGYRIDLKFFPQVSDDLCSINLINVHTDISSPLKDVGVGVSQILPIVISCLSGQNKTFAIEQPELHLHPAAQTELGDLFVDSALGENKNNFIIETHSEHLILRLLRRIRETADDELPENCTPITPDDIAVLYVQPGPDGAEVIELPVNKDGQFDRPWPNGFFAERAKELF